jgi:hypothetical protein
MLPLISWIVNRYMLTCTHFWRNFGMLSAGNFQLCRTKTERSMKKIILAIAALTVLPAAAMAEENVPRPHAPYHRVQIEGKWYTVGAANCNTPAVIGGTRYCPAGKWPSDQEKLNPVNNPVFTNSGGE